MVIKKTLEDLPAEKAEEAVKLAKVQTLGQVINANVFAKLQIKSKMNYAKEYEDSVNKQ